MLLWGPMGTQRAGSDLIQTGHQGYRQGQGQAGQTQVSVASSYGPGMQKRCKEDGGALS